MELELLSGACGAEIAGIDLRNTSDDNIKIIKDQLFEHKVIFFRNQDITHQEQINLSKCFGPIEKHAYVKGLPEYPEILRIVKEPFEKNNWGENWHSDVSYNPEPTLAVILKSVEIPPIGGDTMFANMELAWETLDEKIKIKVKDKKALHSSFNEHPIVRTHPETGKKILYVNWTYTKNIVGIDKKESEDLLTKIFKHQEKLELTCRFKWTKNAVAIWDNRSVIHYAIADYFPNRGLGHRRIMDRVAVRGEKPF